MTDRSVTVHPGRMIGGVDDICPDFWLTPLARTASVTVDPADDLAGFFKALIDVADGLQAWLAQYGLTLAQVVEWQADARLQPTPQHGSRSPTSGGPRWVDGAKKMRYHGVPDYLISIILDVPAERLASMQKMSPVSEHGPAVLKLHQEGLSPYQISNRLQVPKTTVWHIIEKAGYTPKSQRNMLPARTRHEIVELLRLVWGYGEICAKLHVVNHQVSNVKRWAVRRDLLVK